MATTIQEQRIAPTPEHNGATPAAAGKPIEWGNSAPLALAAFAVTTFMLSMINADFVAKGVEPAVFGVALMFGGLTQLLAGLIQFRTGNTFAGVLFSGFGAFWLSLFAIAEFFLKEIPASQVGHALGLFLYAFGFFVISMTIASFRTNAIVVDGAAAAHRRLLRARRGQLRRAHRPRAHRRVPRPGRRSAGHVPLLRGDVRGHLRTQHPPGLAAQPLSARPPATTPERHARVTLRGGPADDEIDRARSGLALDGPRSSRSHRISTRRRVPRPSARPSRARAPG